MNDYIWVSVKQRLPEINKDKIVCTESGKVACGRYIGHGMWHVYTISGFYFCTPVKYWAELPEMPDELKGSASE